MTDFEQYCADYHEHFTRDANECIRLGVERRLDELPDPSASERRERLLEAERLIERANQLDNDSLDFNQSLDLDLARLALDNEVHSATFSWAGQTHVEQCPTAGEQIGDGLFLLLVNDPRPAEERLANIKAKLS